MRACQGGDASIENMLVNEWFLQIPARSQVSSLNNETTVSIVWSVRMKVIR
jgi:hypothetical protein